MSDQGSVVSITVSTSYSSAQKSPDVLTSRSQGVIEMNLYHRETKSVGKKWTTQISSFSSGVDGGVQSPPLQIRSAHPSSVISGAFSLCAQAGN